MSLTDVQMWATHPHFLFCPIESATRLLFFFGGGAVITRGGSPGKFRTNAASGKLALGCSNFTLGDVFSGSTERWWRLGLVLPEAIQVVPAVEGEAQSVFLKAQDGEKLVHSLGGTLQDINLLLGDKGNAESQCKRKS